MHRTARRPGLLLGGLAAMLLGLIGPAARGQTCTPEAKPLVVLLNSATRLQMSSRKNIRTVINPKEGVLAIRTVERDPTTVLLVGSAPGVTRLELEDVDGLRETREVLVQPDLEYLTRQLKAAIPQSSITVTPNGTTSVILTGTVSRAEEINVANLAAQGLGFQVINNLRLPGVQQVQLDVVIARVFRNKRRDFGFNFLQNSRNQILGSTIGGLIPTSTVGVPGALLQPTSFAQAISTTPASTSANLFGGIITNNSGFLGFLQALESEGVIKLLSQPRLVTKSGQPASFLDGGEQAIPVPAGLGQVGVQFEEFGTRLNFLPIVLGNGRIHLEVEPEVSVLSPQGAVIISGVAVQGRTTQRVHTSVEMESGQTYVIGGLIQKESLGTSTKVPVIGQLPFLGVLFSQKSMDERETELVVMVTPHLVDAQSACQVVKVLPGQESRSPDDFELFLEGILEAPRGPRAVFQNGRYVPAHFHGPTAGLLPCAGKGDGLQPCNKGGFGLGSKFGAACPATANCAAQPATHAQAPAPLPGVTPVAVPPAPPAPPAGVTVIPIPAPPPPARLPMVENPPVATEEKVESKMDLPPLPGETTTETPEQPRPPVPPMMDPDSD